MNVEMSNSTASSAFVEEECTAYCFSHHVARSYGPKIPALLSVIGSYIVIREVIASNDLRDRSKTIPRLLLAMSISDIFFSVPYIFTTWAMPPHENLYQSSGNVSTCSIQGAALQFGVSTSPMYNVAISLTALLMIRYNLRPQRLVVAEICMHVIIWSYGLLATIPFLVWGMYNPTSTSCWIASYPHHCGVKDTDAIECIRGEEASFWRGFFAFFPTWPCIVVGITNMIIIYWTVRRLETRNLRYSVTQHAGQSHHEQSNGLVPPSSPRSSYSSETRRRSRAVATQAIFYTCSFLLTFSLDTIVLLWNVMTLQANQMLIVFAYILFPMQGFFNAIVYVRTAELQTPEGRLFRKVFFFAGPLYRRFFVEETRGVPKSSSSGHHNSGGADQGDVDENISSTSETTDFREEQDPTLSTSNTLQEEEQEVIVVSSGNVDTGAEESSPGAQQPLEVFA